MAELTVVQMILIDTLQKKGESQKVTAEKAGCLQSAVTKHIYRKLTGWKSVVGKGAQVSGIMQP